ncbi:G protein-coupled receptor protein, partial [Colletotrichum chrysophilum]
MPWFRFFSSACDEDACAAVDPNAAPSTLGLIFSLSPFLLTFAAVATVA